MSRPHFQIAELNLLAEAAGINLSASIVRIINELLAMRVAPEMIYELFKNICPLSLLPRDGNER